MRKAALIRIHRGRGLPFLGPPFCPQIIPPCLIQFYNPSITEYITNSLSPEKGLGREGREVIPHSFIDRLLRWEVSQTINWVIDIRRGYTRTMHWYKCVGIVVPVICSDAFLNIGAWGKLNQITGTRSLSRTFGRELTSPREKRDSRRPLKLIWRLQLGKTNYGPISSFGIFVVTRSNYPR